MKLRSTLYRAARRMGDLRAVPTSQVPRRIVRRVTGRATGRLFRWLGLTLALAIVLAACGGSKSAQPDLAACEQAMRQDYNTALTNPSTPAASRPAACKGISDAKVQELAAKILSDTNPPASAPPESAPPASATTAATKAGHHIGDTQLHVSDDGTYHAEGKVTLLAYTDNALLPEYRNDPLSSGTPKGFKYVGIQVRVCPTKSNFPDNSVTLSWDPWNLSSRDGDTYEPAREHNIGVFITPFFPDEKTTRVGQCRKGWIPFAVPKNWKPDTVEYIPDLGDTLTWEL